MAKMDGLTCSIRYLDGKLISAETRGNGIIGEDITHNIKFVKDVPLEIPIKDEVIVDGEVADEAKLKTLASIPSRDTLLTMFAAGLMEHVKNVAICLDLHAQNLEENN